MAHVRHTTVAAAAPGPLIQGTLTFEGDAIFTGNMANTDDSDEQAKAGAISNTGSGTILFNSKLTLAGSEAEVSISNVGDSR